MPTRPGKEYYIYILTNRVRTLYIGVTNDLVRRVYEHKHKLVEGFTKKYDITWLAYYEQTSDVLAAIEREKQIKSWRRSKKVELYRIAQSTMEGFITRMVRERGRYALDSSLHSE